MQHGKKYKGRVQSRVASRPLFGLGSFERANYKYGDYRKKGGPSFHSSPNLFSQKIFRILVFSFIVLTMLFVPFTPVEGL